MFIFEIVEVERQLMIFCVLNKLAQPFIHFKTKNIKNPKNHRNRGFLCAKNFWFLLSNCEYKSQNQIFVKFRGFVPRFFLGSRSLLLQPLTKKGVLEQIIVDKWHSLWSKRDWRDIGLVMQGGQSQHYQDSKRRT